MDKTNTSSYRMPAAVLLAGVLAVFLLGGCPKHQECRECIGTKINVDSALAANQAIADSYKSVDSVAPTVISMDSLRTLLGVDSLTSDSTIAKWFRYSSCAQQIVDYSPVPPDPLRRSLTVSSFVDDKLPLNWLHLIQAPTPPPPPCTLMPDFTDHEISNLFNCVAARYPLTLDSVINQLGVAITTPRVQSYMLAPDGCVGVCNAADRESYVTYWLSENQMSKWDYTSTLQKMTFLGQLRAFKVAVTSGGAANNLVFITGLQFGSFSTKMYTSSTNTITTSELIPGVSLHLIQLKD